ncbi:asparagine synthase (glutamine-hydrolyzing) [Candidatus Pelagibacter sp.]|nr:asparagine synthase (glutamine-hydrolyzing) [Candidatus Pelagibacter sp.]
MCGIAGYIGRFPPGPNDLKKTSEVLKHRGPNYEGFYNHKLLDNNVALVHRRLSIIDLDNRSNQPFTYEGTVLVFNGEIYNYMEIRKQLKELGHVFKTFGDTEVLAHALHQWGQDALEKLEGMWAFAWYNEESGTMLLSRDRFGEKPLYVWSKNNGLYFASEVKGLAAIANDSPKINENHLIRNLVNGYRSLYKTNETFFLEVKELPPGTCLKIESNGKSFSSNYWKPKLMENNNLSYSDAVDMTRETVINAIKLRMRSDVPIAFCMSGGVDSNSLISVASKILECEVHGFTIVNTDARYEEQSIVDQSVKELGIKHTSVKLNKHNFLKNLRSLINHHDAPVYTISYYLHWQLMQSIADKGYKVTISGTAADELFTGYYDHHNLYLYEVSKNKTLYKKSLDNWNKYQEKIVRNPYLRDPNLYLKDPKFRDHNFMHNDLFASCLKEKWKESFVETDFTESLLRNRMLNEMFAETVPVILHEDDLNAMYFSMENRSPFLDSALFDLAYSIPSQFLIKDGRAKAVLRDAMQGIVPDIILEERRKVGFNAPVLDLLDLNDPDVKGYLLDDSRIYNLVKKENIEKILKQEHLPNSTSKFLFNFLNAKIFLENQIS